MQRSCATEVGGALRRRVLRALLWVGALVVLPAYVGCATPDASSFPAGEAVGEEAVGAGEESEIRPYANARLRPGLAVDVSLLLSGRREFEETAKRVSEEGTITLPLLGAVSVEGYTLDEVSEELTEHYSLYYRAPQLLVDFHRETGDAVSPWGHVTVLGRVNNPGRVGIPPTRDLTVSGAIQEAGGFDSSPRRDSIRVSHRRNGETETRTVDLNAAGAEGRLEEDIQLQNGDVVYVPESRF